MITRCNCSLTSGVRAPTLYSSYLIENSHIMLDLETWHLSIVGVATAIAIEFTGLAEGS